MFRHVMTILGKLVCSTGVSYECCDVSRISPDTLVGCLQTKLAGKSPDSSGWSEVRGGTGGGTALERCELCSEQDPT